MPFSYSFSKAHFPFNQVQLYVHHQWCKYSRRDPRARSTIILILDYCARIGGGARRLASLDPTYDKGRRALNRPTSRWLGEVPQQLAVADGERTTTDHQLC